MNSFFQRYGIAIALGLLAGLAYFSGLDALELRAEEPRRALVAMEMVLTGEYMIPHTYGMPYYNKPPLFNWAIAGLFNLFGTWDEWAVRLPSLLALFATAFALYYFVKRNAGRTLGWMAGLMYLTCADILYYGAVNAGEIDLFYTFFIALQTIPLYYISKKRTYWPFFLWAYAACALATLTKSFPALVFLGLTLIAWLVVEGKWKRLFSLGHAAGIGLYLLIIGAYLIAYSRQHELAYLAGNWLYEGTDKAAGEGGIQEFFTGLFTFWPIFIKIGLPWTLVLFFLFKRSIRNRLWRMDVSRFILVFLMANIWLYWLVLLNKERYMYPFFPMLCALMAYLYVEAPVQIRKKRLLLWVAAVMFALRIGYNVFVLPAMDDGRLSEGYIYRETSEDIVSITEGQPVHVLGELEHYSFELETLSVDSLSWERPSIFPYQIPYYTVKKNGHIMRWVKEVQPGNYYLAPVIWLREQNIEGDSLYTFTEGWGNKEVLLFRAK